MLRIIALAACGILIAGCGDGDDRPAEKQPAATVLLQATGP